MVAEAYPASVLDDFSDALTPVFARALPDPRLRRAAAAAPIARDEVMRAREAAEEP